MTGSLGADGTIFAQTLDEGGGGLGGPRQNFIHRSTDGGVTWSAPIAQGATFTGPGRAVCSDNSYFACMYAAPGFWGDMGWGEPAVGPSGVVHYAYSAHGAGSDPGDVYYVRSTDTGSTWSVPLKLNTDATTREQWGPSLSVNTTGQVFVSWYDERNTSTDALERFGRASTDNGATWGSDMAVSDVIFPKPLQPDPNVRASYAGIYHRTAFSNDGSGTFAYHTWTDGRVLISGSPQEDVFFDKVLFAACTPGSWLVKANYPAVLESPAVGTDGTFAYSAGGFAGAASNGVYRYNPVANTWATLPTLPTALYDARATYAANTNSFYVFGGYDGSMALGTSYRFDLDTFSWTPVAAMPASRVWPNVAYYAATGKIYVIGGFDSTFTETNQTWEYDPVANTWNTSRAPIPNPMTGSAASIAGQFIYLAGSYGGGAGTTLHNRYDIINNTWASMAPVPVPVFLATGGAIGSNTYLVGGGNPFLAQRSGASPAALGASPRVPSSSYNTTYIYNIGGNSWSAGPNTNVSHAYTGGTVIGGRLLVVAGYNGSVDTNTVESQTVVCPSCTTEYTTATTTGNAIVSGSTDIGNHCDDCTTPLTLPFPVTLYGTTFTSAQASSNGNLQFTGNTSYLGVACPLPDVNLGMAIMPYQDDLRTDGTFEGIFTSVSGVAPNRVFNIEWRTHYFGRSGTANFEVRLSEGSPNFEVIYGSTIDNGLSEESGVQQSATGPATQFSCNTATLASGLKVTYTASSCPSALLSAVSRKVHDGAGTFDINLPLVPLGGAVGIEDRTGAVAGAHQNVVTFANPVTVGGSSATSGTGSIGSFSVSGAVVTLNLTGVTNAQRLGVTLADVHGSDGVSLGDLLVPMGVLLGDTSGNGSVTSTDVTQTKAQSGLAVSASNFREDVNANGAINGTDVSSVKSKSGTALP